MPEHGAQKKLSEILLFYSTFYHEYGAGYEAVISEFVDEGYDEETFAGLYGSAEDARLVPANLLSNMGDIQHILRMYKSDVTEFFREVITDKDNNAIPSVDIPNPISIEDEEGGRMLVPFDKVTMFLVPETVIERTRLTKDACQRN